MEDGHRYVQGHTSRVNLGFYRGTALNDPAARLEGTGAKMRHVKARTIADVHAAELRDLVVAAASERRAARA